MNRILCISIILMFCPTVPDSHSITITSSSGSVVQNGSSVTLTCTIELDPAVRESELPLLLVDALLLKDGADDPMALTALTLTGTTFSYTTLIYTLILVIIMLDATPVELLLDREPLPSSSRG